MKLLTESNLNTALLHRPPGPVDKSGNLPPIELWDARTVLAMANALNELQSSLVGLDAKAPVAAGDALLCKLNLLKGSPRPNAKATPGKINQALVDRIITRARASEFGLGDGLTHKQGHNQINQYGQPTLQALGMLLINGYDAKYDLISVVVAALETVTEEKIYDAAHR